MVGVFNSSTEFTLFGGEGIYSTVKGVNAADLSESEVGDVLESRVFKNELIYDSKWVSFGPFNPQEGESIESFGAQVFKMLAVGKNATKN